MHFGREGVDRWFAEAGATVESVERVTNHLHLWDVFAAKSAEEYRALSQLARTMQLSWQAALAAAFPGRQFAVEVADEPEEYGPTLTLFSR